MNLPRISLVTPSYNQAQFLEAALESVVAQNYPNLEWIAMDGGSTDRSVELLRRYEKYFAYWTSEQDGGQADALQRGFARATGEIFGWLNSDDMLMQGALNAVGSYFAAHPECDFLAGDGEYVNADDTRVLYTSHAMPYSFDDLLHFYQDKFLPQPAVFFSRTAFQCVGGLDTTLTYTMDLDLFLRLRRLHPLHCIHQPLAKLRQHQDAKSRHAGHPHLVAVEHETRRYWSEVAPLERMKILMGLRWLRARATCDAGLERVVAGDAQSGWDALITAHKIYPFVLTTPVARRLVARLVLPMGLRRRWLRVP